MKKKYFIGVYVLLFALCFIASNFINKSYSLTCSFAYPSIEMENGKYVAKYFCDDDNTGDTYQISQDDAINKLGVSKYQEAWVNGQNRYFNINQEISENEYLNGLAEETADYLYKAWGDVAIRVHSTQEFKQQIDNLYNNKKMGAFHFIFSQRENVNVKEAYNYYMSKYGVSNRNQNYYRYSLKGEAEPVRFAMRDDIMNSFQEAGDAIIDTFHVTSDFAPIRLSKEQKDYTNAFVDKLVPILFNGANTDAQKVYRAAKYLRETAVYHDLTNHQILAEGQTSIYNAFIQRQTVCIGYSIAFSYLMDKVGIESYIVDVNQVNDNWYSSSHTYNIVKIDGKMYQVDVTSGWSINGVTGNLSANNFNKSNTGINTSGFSDYDHNAVNNLWNQYRGGVSTNLKYYYKEQPTFPEYKPVQINGTKVNYDVNNNTSNNGDNNNNNNNGNNNNGGEEHTTTQQYEYNEGNTTTTADSNTKVIKITDESGEVVATTHIVYDENNYVTSTITNSEGENVVIAYDKDGNVLGVMEDIPKEELENASIDNSPLLDKKLITNCLIIVAVALVIILIILFINDKKKVKVSMSDL